MELFDIIELYHAGTSLVKTPDISFSRRDLDFGPGFYLTDMYDQAVSWTVKRASKRGGEAIVNKYLLHRKEMFSDPACRRKFFPAYDEEWLDFVVGNRTGSGGWKEFDYIEGGVADDRIVDTIDLYFQEYISKKETLERLKYLRPNNQICITNQEYLDKYLAFRDWEEITVD